MIEQLKYDLQTHWLGIRSCYTQVFFSNNKWFALVLFISTFTDVYAGFCGLTAIILTHCIAIWLGLNVTSIRNGTYGYNSLMVGLVLGVNFKFNLIFLLILFLSSLLCLLFSSWLGILLDKYKVPFLSMPFLLTIWILLLATRNYQNLELSERGVFRINDWYLLGGDYFILVNEWLMNLKLPLFLEVYLNSLGAIIFQSNLIAGVLIAIGLLLFSRIAFSLSLLGYTTGFIFYQFVDGSFNELIYSYIGFNFILLAIGIGGFFLIPSAKSYALVIICTPLTAIIISSLGGLFAWFQLPIYSLPFNIIAILLLFVLIYRTGLKSPQLVTYQLYSPEKNLYAQQNWKDRFSKDTYFHISLPFWGEWTVSQGYEGNITHKDAYKYALDFVVEDGNKRTYQLPGTSLSDFYCYNLPVTAPAAGWITEVKDGIPDNSIGDVNLKENWGNTIIIKHSDFLYSKLSHIKSGSPKVKAGDYVYKGQVLGTCGSSGRSPEPHVHFQLQATPYIGSPTLYYPLSYFISNQNGKYQFHAFDIPTQGQIISNVVTNGLMNQAFGFIPGQIMEFEVTEKNIVTHIKWEVMTNSLNQTYIYCHNTKSIAYLVNNYTLFYFTEFQGDKKSLLYHFYLGAQKLVLGFYQDLEISDRLPVSVFYPEIVQFFHDFTAPFFHYISTEYKVNYSSVDDQHF
ncbi:MAG: urea transporter, partial [Cytophagales bacterium]|nr:urea transporter [Cytophagales bacterium]